ASAEERGLAQFLRLLFRFGDEDLLQVAEVLGARHVALLHRGVAVEIPQLDGRLQRGAQPDVWVAMLRAPYDGLGADHAGNPNRWTRLLVGQHPGIHEAISEMFAFPSK